MRTLTPLVLILLSLFLLAGCQSVPPIVGGGGGTGGSTDQTPITAQPMTVIAQPGGEGQIVAFSSDDQTTSSTAGDGFGLVLAGSTEAMTDYLNAPDPVKESIIEEMKAAAKRAEDDPANLSRWLERLDQLRQELREYMKEKLEAAKGLSGGANLPALAVLIYAPFSIRIAGVDPSKLPADTVRAGGEVTEKAIAPAIKFAEN